MSVPDLSEKKIKAWGWNPKPEIVWIPDPRIKYPDLVKRVII